MIFSGEDERTFLENDRFKRGGTLELLKFDLIMTDKPYDINKMDGTSNDRAIPDADVELICRLWHTLSSPIATVCCRLHPEQLGQWAKHLRKAGWFVDTHPTRTERMPHTNLFSRGKQLGPGQVGDMYVIAHKVPLHFFFPFSLLHITYNL